MINNATNYSLANWIVYGYLSISAGQSTEATRSVAKWSLSDRFMSNPYCIFCRSDGCKKAKKAHYWTLEPLSEFEFGGGETVIKIAESKNKSWFPSMDQGIGHLWLWSKVPPNFSEKVHRTPRKKFWYSEGVGKKLEKQNLEISCTAAYEQLCCLVDGILVKRKWIVKMTCLLGKYTDSRNPLNLT